MHETPLTEKIVHFVLRSMTICPSKCKHYVKQGSFNLLTVYKGCILSPAEIYIKAANLS